MWLASIVCWMLYGIFLGLFSVIMWNCVTMMLAGFMMYAKLKWGIRAKQDKTAQ
jgi:uncharacterized protein with PQ loop repeat